MAPPTEVVEYAANAYCTVAQVTDAYGGFTIPSPATQWTDNSNQELNRAIISSSDQINQITSQYFGQLAATIEVDGTGTNTLPIGVAESIPLLSASQVQFRDGFTKTYDWDANATVIDVDSWDVSRSRISLVRLGSLAAGRERLNEGRAGTWVKGWKNYRITAVLGREEVPVLIERACILMVRESIDPGFNQKFEKFIRERWEDGYEYERPKQTTADLLNYTGIYVVDRILEKFIDDLPEFSFIEFGGQ